MNYDGLRDWLDKVDALGALTTTSPDLRAKVVAKLGRSIFGLP